MNVSLTTEDHDRLVTTAVDLLTQALNGTYGEPQPRTRVEGDLIRRSYITEGLQSYTAPTLQKIIEMRSDNLFFWHYSILDGILRGDLLMDEGFVSDYLHLSHCFENTDLRKRITEATLAFVSFRHYENLIPNVLGEAYPARRNSQATAIISITQHMQKFLADGNLSMKFYKDPNATIDSFTKGMYVYISDPQIRTLITADDCDPAAITRIITERNLTNYDDIIAILQSQQGNPSPALHQGIL